jgi:hypothetical protein
MLSMGAAERDRLKVASQATDREAGDVRVDIERRTGG